MNRPTQVGVTSKTGHSQNLTHIATAWAGGARTHTTARPARASVPRRVGPAFKHCRASFRRSTSAHTNKQAVLNRHRTELGREFRHRQVRTSLKTVLAHVSHEPGPLAKLFKLPRAELPTLQPVAALISKPVQLARGYVPNVHMGIRITNCKLCPRWNEFISRTFFSTKVLDVVFLIQGYLRSRGFGIKLRTRLTIRLIREVA